MALDGTTAILETHLLPKEELYKRWFGATHEEIARHFTEGELCAYERYKGPINGIIWCKPGHVYYQSQVSYSNPDLYDYNDDSCDYFLLEDVVRCETEHPEYIGNVTPESLGLAQVDTSGTPEEEPEYIKAESLRKEMGLSPVLFVDYLRDNRELCLYGVDDSIRGWFYGNASREQAADMLDDMYIHQIDILAHKRRLATDAISEIDTRIAELTPGLVDDYEKTQQQAAELESQLAEAQKHIESLLQLNNRLNEQNQKLRAELDAAQEVQPAAAEPTSTVDVAKWENSVKAVLEIWAEIFQGNKVDWKEEECRAALAKRYSDYHTKVHSLAWSLLPGAFKHGRGRPKKNPEKSQQSDNT